MLGLEEECETMRGSKECVCVCERDREKERENRKMKG